MITEPDDLRARFDALTVLLRQHRTLWTERPFVVHEVSWESEYGEVAVWLRNLDHDAIDELEEHGAHHRPDVPEALAAWSQLSADHVSLGAFPQAELRDLPRDNDKGVPLRKQLQAKAFVETLQLKLRRGSTVVDWCSGKGTLSRTLSLSCDVDVVGLERRRDLCDTATTIAKGVGARCRFVQADVMDLAGVALPTAQAVVGLHACGVLTDALFDFGIRHGMQAILAAPCCYHHLGGDRTYTPRSEAGRAAELGLTQWHLRLPTAHEQVARMPIRKARRRELAYRLGFDLLARKAAGDTYRPQGPFSKSLFDGPFDAFCRAASKRVGVELSTFDPESALSAGVERARRVRGLSVVRGLFRRPLELWLALDRALGIVERGRPVALGTFCARTVTPRNLLLASVM